MIVLKILAAPFVVVLTVLAAVVSFLFCMATAVFVVACVVLFLKNYNSAHISKQGCRWPGYFGTKCPKDYISMMRISFSFACAKRMV